MRTRPPRPGTIVADIAGYLGSAGRAGIDEIHTAVNARRQQRGLPPVPKSSVRGTLNSNKETEGHGMFNCESRGVYSLSRRP